MNRLALLMLLPLAATAGAREMPGQDPELIAAPPNAEGAMLALGDLDQRLTVPVAVGGQGSYNFIIDTGAERTVISRELAGMLKLSAGTPVTMTSMTGRSLVDTVVIPGLSIRSIGDSHTVIAPALGARDLGAVGLLGIDTLRNHQVSIDFDAGIMSVRRSEKRKRQSRRDPDEITVTAKSLFGQLIVTDAYFGNTRIQVVLDTGSQVTMGNSVLRKRVSGRMRGIRPIQLTSVTGDKAYADYTSVPDIKIGGVLFDSLPIAFADVAPFERFGLTKRPALLLGMDALRAFRRVDIDFPNREVRFLLPRSDRLAPQGPTSPLIPGVRGPSPGRTL